MKRIACGLILLILVNGVLAQEELFNELEKNWGELQKTEMPGFLKGLLGEEKIQAELILEKGEKLDIGILIEEGKFKELKKGILEEASLKVYGTEEVVKEILEGENPLAGLKKALGEGRIKYEAKGWKNKLKWGIAAWLLKMAGEKEEKEEWGGELKEKEKTEEEKKAEEKKEETKEIEAKEEKEIKEAEGANKEEEKPKTKSHLVELVDGGLGVSKLTINRGEKVIWQNVREGRINKAMIIGSRGCKEIRSQIFYPGNYFSWTFEKAGECVIVDGIYTTQTMKVVVE